MRAFALPCNAMYHKARLIGLSILLALGMSGYYFGIFIPRARATRAAHNIGFFYAEDMYPYWWGTRELLTHKLSPYSEQATREIQTALYGRALDPDNPYERDQHRFSYPLYVTVLMSPVAWLPFSIVRTIGAVLLPALFIVSLILWNHSIPKRLSDTQLIMATILALATYPLLDGLLTQQISLIVFFAVSSAAWLVYRMKFLAAGITLAIATIKPQLVACPILFLLIWSFTHWRERRRLALGFMGAMAVLFAVSALLLPSWPVEWWHTIVSYRQYTVPPLVPFLLGTRLGAVLTWILLGSSLWISWLARHEDAASERFILALSYTLAVSVVTIPMGNAVYDHILVIPAVLFILSRWRTIVSHGTAMRLLFFIGAAVFAWQWVSGTVIFVLQHVAPGVIRSPLILSSPLRTQPSVPFVVLALLSLEAVRCFTRTQPVASMNNAIQTSSSSSSH